MTQFLYDNYSILSSRISKDIPDFLVNNLKAEISLRDYQIEAFARFFDYYSVNPEKKIPIHLLFNMATGSGKTIIFAGLVLYLYKQGYRNFIFFTRLEGVVQKTKDNFLKEKKAKKYLFADKIIINGKEIKIKEVNNFSAISKNDIYIKFQTIGGLHSDIKTPKENSINLESLKNKKIVLIGDESHNFNANTKKQIEEQSSWEETINQVLNLENKGRKENILLEFTATVDYNNENIIEKYKDKIIYRYDLTKFRRDKFSKEIKNIQLDTGAKEDFKSLMLQAVLLSQYRRKVSQDFLKKDFKPVILFKSQTIAESGKRMEEFKNLIKNLKASDIKELFNILIERSKDDKSIKKLERDLRKEIEDKKITQEEFDSALGHQRVDQKVFDRVIAYFKSGGITHANLAKEIQQDFSEEKIIFTNDKKNKNKTEKISFNMWEKLNSLEEKDNLYRAIFTVEKLNEGWDVLNLFDIVRLYDTRDEAHDKNRNRMAGKTTISEVQLIGRGSRYYPFSVNENVLSTLKIKFSSDDNNKYKRKFDFYPYLDLASLETFYYHSIYNYRYITELQNELIRKGFKDKRAKKVLTIRLKEEFKETSLYKNGKVYQNRPREKDKTGKTELKKICKKKFGLYSIGVVKFQTGELMSYGVAESQPETIEKNIRLKEINKNILKKAFIKTGDFFEFLNLKENYFYSLESTNELLDILKKTILEVKIERGKKISDFSKKDKLNLTLEFLKDFKKEIRQEITRFEGEKEFFSEKVKQIFKDERTIYVSVKNSDSDQERGISQKREEETKIYVNIDKKKWYAYDDNFGTDQEKYFVKYIDQMMIELEKKFKNIYLLRNEQFFKIYKFSNGQAIMPDFILFMDSKNNGEKISYQLFCEPKGENLLKSDKWKEDFLIEIEKEKKIKKLFENEKVKIIGMPFYNEVIKDKFEQAFSEKFICKNG